MVEGDEHGAVQAFEIAKRAFDAGDIEKADRFALKSLRLYPTENTRKLLREIKIQRQLRERAAQREQESQSAANQSHGTEHHKHSSNHHSHEHRRPHRDGASDTASTSNSDASDTRTSTSSNHSQAELDAIKRVKACKTYYEVLRVSKDATEEEIKKSYKKLALQFHPDKNTAPGSDEAFKIVSKAYACLSDPEKRRHYDMVGDESTPQRSNQRYHYQEGDISPEEIFNMFFGVSPGRGGFMNEEFVRRRQFRHQTQGRNVHHAQFNIMQLLPLIFLLVVAFMGSSKDEKPVFRYELSDDYPVERTTQRYDVPYFVSRDFNANYAKDKRYINNLERTVLNNYQTYLTQKCNIEKQQIPRDELKGLSRYDINKKYAELHSCQLLRQWNSA